MNNEKYMLIQKTGLKVPLKAVDGEFKIKSGRKVLLSVNPSIERYLIYWIYGERNESEIACWLRECWDKNITPMRIDEVINSFKKSHPAEEIEDFPLEDIPLCASKEGLVLPIPGDRCVISFENEKQLMDMICKDKTEALSHLKYWFYRYRGKYGLDYSKYCKDQQDFYLAESFLHQHGLSVKLMIAENERGKAEKERKTILFTSLAFIIIIPALLCFMLSYDNSFDTPIALILTFMGVTTLAYRWFAGIFCSN
jgi:hypothetical protein